MKLKGLIIALCLLCSQVSFSQFWYYLNTSPEASTRVGGIALAAAVTDVMAYMTMENLKDTDKEMKQLIDRYYKYNRLDKFHEKEYNKDLFIQGVETAVQAAMANGKIDLPYYTQGKQDYTDELLFEDNTWNIPISRLVLKHLDIGRDELMKFDNRMEIYKLRKEIVKLEAEENAEARSQILLPLGVYLYKNRNDLARKADAKQFLTQLFSQKMAAD